MKFVYVDESGNNEQDRFLAFFGLQIDAYRLKTATREVKPVLERITVAYPEDLREVKSSRMVNGRGGWRHVDPEIRKELFLELCGFVDEIAARAYAFVLDRQAYANLEAARRVAPWRGSPWLTGATAIALFAQRQNQREPNNKGLTVLIFDDNKVELPRLTEFLVSSSPDADEFYERRANAEPFDNVIDTAFAIKSEHSTLVQVSDACAYALRRRAELALGGVGEAWDGEADFVENAFARFRSRVRLPTRTWTRNPFCEAAHWLKEVGIDDLNAWFRG